LSHVFRFRTIKTTLKDLNASGGQCFTKVSETGNLRNLETSRRSSPPVRPVAL